MSSHCIDMSRYMNQLATPTHETPLAVHRPLRAHDRREAAPCSASEVSQAVGRGKGRINVVLRPVAGRLAEAVYPEDIRAPFGSGAANPDTQRGHGCPGRDVCTCRTNDAGRSGQSGVATVPAGPGWVATIRGRIDDRRCDYRQTESSGNTRPDIVGRGAQGTIPASAGSGRTGQRQTTFVRSSNSMLNTPGRLAGSDFSEPEMLTDTAIICMPGREF